MPLNIAGRKVRNMLFKDLCETGDALVVTGYNGKGDRFIFACLLLG